MSDKYQNTQSPSPTIAAKDVATPGETHGLCGTHQVKSPNRGPPLSLKQAESLVGLLSDERAPIPNLSDAAVRARRLVGQSFRLSERVINQIKAIAMTKDETKLADYLSGDAAQTLIDTFHEAVGLSRLPPQLRRKSLSALCRICGHRALLPRSLQIPLCYDRSSFPLYRGGCAEVWKGEYQGQSVAAKVVKIYTTSDLRTITRRFCKEVITWNTLDHPNVLPLLGVTMDGQQFVMVSEWMSNGNINQFIKTHKDANRFQLLEDVARGLIYIHGQEMVHGDLKGANILVDPNGRARLADFGFLTIVSDVTLSSSFAGGGTIRWMSPELFYPDKSGIESARPTKQSDCYAFGMVIYEVLTGQPPFATFNCCVVMCKVTVGERPSRPNGPEGAQFTDDLWRTLNRCWAARPQRRPSVTTVLERLERVSVIVRTPSSRSGESTGLDEGDWGVSSDFSRVNSRFSTRRPAAFLCGVLCLSRLQAISRKLLPRKRGRADVGASQRTAFTQGRGL